MDAAARIASFVMEARPQAIPNDALEQAKIGIFDSLGVALAGCSEEGAQICAALARHESSQQEATVIGRGFQSSAIQAAFANGAAVHALDFDLSFGGLGQPTAPVLPAVLALAETRGVSGLDLLNAYLTGFEVTAKLGFTLPPGAGEGWHAPGTLGVIGACAGVAKLLGLDASQIPMALGIACSMAGGLTSNFGTMTKPLHVAVAARDGVTAAKLASEGFTANDNAFQARNGFYSLFFGEAPPKLERLDELGKSYGIVEEGLRLKPYPCGGLTHAAIDATLALRHDYDLKSEQIASVVVLVRRHVFNTISFKVPANGTQGKFCMPYLIARTLIDGRLTLDSFTDAAVQDTAVLALASKVEMRTDGSSDRPSEVTLRLRSGETLTHSVLFAKGGVQAPLSPAEVEDKFLDCASRTLGESQAHELLKVLNHLEELADVRQLGRLLAGREA